jgi:hypothetical protein
MSLARVNDDPALKRRYEALAVEFAQNIGGERDLDIAVAPLAGIEPKPDSGDSSATGRKAKSRRWIAPSRGCR